MKYVVVINASPRTGWNTAMLVKKAAEGAEAAGAQVDYFDLYQSEAFTGCISCFGCKREGHLGRCIHKDGLSPILEAIEKADGLIIGSPNYLGDLTAGFRALYERLIFQSLSYKTDPRSYREKKTPVLLITTSNCPEAAYPNTGYDTMLEKYKGTLEWIIGPTKILVHGDTLQVKNYDLYNWTMFDPEAKKARHESEVPKALEKAFAEGYALL